MSRNIHFAHLPLCTSSPEQFILRLLTTPSRLNVSDSPTMESVKNVDNLQGRPILGRGPLLLQAPVLLSGEPGTPFQCSENAKDAQQPMGGVVELKSTKVEGW